MTKHPIPHFLLALLPLLTGACTKASGDPALPEKRLKAYEEKARPLAEPWKLESTPEQALMLELYTALNCPGCPPADMWMDFFVEGDLDQKGNSPLWSKLVPVTWHVTYFDTPRATDPLGLRDSTMRQTYINELRGKEANYTPAFYTNGDEWRGLYEGRPLTHDKRATGTLKLENLGGDKGMTLEFTPAPGFEFTPYAGEMRGWLVLQVGNVYTDVRRGPESREPRPASFAVQAWKAARVTKNSEGKWTGKFDALPFEAVKAKWPGATLSIAAWVTADAEAFEPLQATGSWVK
jgi:hypothetical protein